jgi:nucleotide-binding universal stress UspA family protein
VAVTGEAVVGAPTATLLERSRSASVVVIGDRGHGGFTGLLMGSVSQAVLHHAACPVAVVPYTHAPAR